MNLLLDTHVFLWSLFAPENLNEHAFHQIKSTENDVAVSVVTFWEISLKYGLGKLELTGMKLPAARSRVSERNCAEANPASLFELRRGWPHHSYL